jgi:hypothetical protein
MNLTREPTPRWRLANHVRACCVDGQVILLDLQRGKYVGVGGPLVSALPQLIDGWPTAVNATGQDADASALTEWVENFRSQRMLIEARGPAPKRPPLDEPVHSMNAEDDEPSSGFQWRQLLRLWHAAAITAISLKRRSLEDIASAVAAARTRKTGQATPDAAALRRAVAAYIGVRPFAFTAHDRCLHDSLTLTRFLAMQGLSASWVIGVRTRPFGAHSWVQSGGVVLNDQHENVRRYRPILVV